MPQTVQKWATGNWPTSCNVLLIQRNLLSWLMANGTALFSVTHTQWPWPFLSLSPLKCSTPSTQFLKINLSLSCHQPKMLFSAVSFIGENIWSFTGSTPEMGADRKWAVNNVKIKVQLLFPCLFTSSSCTLIQCQWFSTSVHFQCPSGLLLWRFLFQFLLLTKQWNTLQENTLKKNHPKRKPRREDKLVKTGSTGKKSG